MVTRNFSTVPAFYLACALAAPTALAQPASPAAEPRPATSSDQNTVTPPAPEPASQPEHDGAASGAPEATLHHAPRSVAPAHVPMDLRAEIENPHRVRHAILLYRVLGNDPKRPHEWTEIEFLRSSPGPYVAVVPERDVAAPGLEYAIELELLDGSRVRSFASREEPFGVSVSEDLMDVRERVALERLHGRRSVVSSSVEYVSFGKSARSSADGSTANVDDSYYRVEASYTYRPLRLVDEFSVHVGAVRGTSPVPASTNTPADTSVGLNYAAPSVRFRLSDVFRLEVETLASVTEVGFSLGGGAALDVGDPYGSKWRVGFESIDTFGTRFFSQVDIHATTAFRLSPIIEATDMPHANRYGVRLIGEAAYEFTNGFGIAVRGGYQARNAASGGPSAGATLNFAF
jgi:hypothetical protein